MEKTLQGSVGPFGVPDVLTFLNLGRLGGVLVFENPDQETKLFFQDGSPVFANSTKPALRFGTMLSRFGKLTEDMLARLTERQPPGIRIGQILLQAKVLSEAELASFLKVQVSEVIFDTFSWRSGVFTFYDGVPAPSTAVRLDIAIQNLIMEGVRRLDERARLSEVFPHTDYVVEVVANPERVKQNVTLIPEEWQVFFLVDGRRSLQEICRASGNPDELATLEILRRLFVAKFVIVRPPHPGADVEGGADRGLVLGNRTAQGKASGAKAPAPVAFTPPLPEPAPKDDTKEVVNPKATPYLQDAKKVTVSRLILQREGGESSFPLTGDSYTLGRHRNNDIQVSDSKVSSFHARIDRSPEGFVLVDLSSRNGTFLNGKKIQSGLLKTGDEIRLGTASLVYKIDYTSAVEGRESQPVG
jgi:hypothetical protein